MDGLLVKDDHFYRMTISVHRETAKVGLLGPSYKTVLWDGLLVKRLLGRPFTFALSNWHGTRWNAPSRLAGVSSRAIRSSCQRTHGIRQRARTRLERGSWRASRL